MSRLAHRDGKFGLYREMTDWQRQVRSILDGKTGKLQEQVKAIRQSLTDKIENTKKELIRKIIWTIIRSKLGL